MAREVVLLGEQHRHAIEALVAELDDAAATRADEMLMVRLVSRGLEALEAFAEVALDHEARAHHDVERAIDGGGAYGGAARPELLFDLVRRHVAIAAQHHFGHRLPLGGHGQIVVAKVREKGLYR